MAKRVVGEYTWLYLRYWWLYMVKRFYNWFYMFIYLAMGGYA